MSPNLFSANEIASAATHTTARLNLFELKQKIVRHKCEAVWAIKVEPQWVFWARFEPEPNQSVGSRLHLESTTESDRKSAIFQENSKK